MSAGVPRRHAGEALLEWAAGPDGEAVFEGALGGLIAGVPLFLVQDQSDGQATLMTASAVLGGIGAGLAGQRLGRALGRRMHQGAPELLEASGRVGGMTGRILGGTAGVVGGMALGGMATAQMGGQPSGSPGGL